MTSSTVPVDLGDDNPDEVPPARPRDPGAQRTAPQPDRGWAVVEIRRDGTLGHLELVTAAGVVEAARAARRAEGTRAAPTAIDPALEVHLGQLQAAHGQLRESATSFRRGLSAATTTTQRESCLGHLALVEAYRGQLHSSAAHESQARPHRAAAGAPGQLARAWRHLEQGELADADRCLDGDPAPDPGDQPWLTTIRTLLVAELLMASGRPEAAARLLGDVPSAGGAAPAWSTGVLAVARAEALLAEGETQRALAAITPLPPRATVEASVTAAAARVTIGDLRGAQAVLEGVVDRLDLAPLGLQVRAWLLEGRLAQHRGRHERSRLLVGRALQAAAAEGMRNAVRRDWMWLRAMADRDPALLRGHRELLTNLAGLDAVARSRALGGSAPHSVPGGPMGGALTVREAQVLELLAQMYSTEEIAAALYVSGNTVKTHLKGIFGKLCVNRRVDAVRRGRQLGLC